MKDRGRELNCLLDMAAVCSVDAVHVYVFTLHLYCGDCNTVFVLIFVPQSSSPYICSFSLIFAHKKQQLAFTISGFMVSFRNTSIHIRTICFHYHNHFASEIALEPSSEMALSVRLLECVFLFFFFIIFIVCVSVCMRFAPLLRFFVYAHICAFAFVCSIFL